MPSTSTHDQILTISFCATEQKKSWIGIFVIIGCIASPLLANNSSIFEFIQKFQGYVSTGIVAVFIYGLANRSGGDWAGVIGLVANPIIYYLLSESILFPETHFLYSMSYSLIAVLAILFIYGYFHQRAEKIIFSTNTSMDLTRSNGALWAGWIVCILTVILYIIFW